MSSQTNKKALKQLEKTEFLVVSARTWKPTVNARLGDGGAPPRAHSAGPPPGQCSVCPPPGGPDWNQVQDWCIAQLGSSAESLRRADRDHRDQRVLLQQARLDRDRQLSELETGQRALRRSFSGTYGQESLALVGLDAEPARALLAAREQIRGVVVLMRDKQMAAGLPEPIAGQSPIVLGPLADFWDGRSTALEGKMVEIDQLRKQAQEAMIGRDEALKRSRRVYANAGRMLEGLYRFAGLDELADRIRLTERSARKKEANEEPRAAPEEQPARSLSRGRRIADDPESSPESTPSTSKDASVRSRSPTSPPPAPLPTASTCVPAATSPWPGVTSNHNDGFQVEVERADVPADQTARFAGEIAVDERRGAELPL